MAQGNGGVAAGTRSARARASASEATTAQPPLPVGHRHQRIGGGGVLRESAATARHSGPDGLGIAPLQCRPAADAAADRARAAAGRRRVATRRRRARRPDGRPRRWSATPCNGTGAPPAPPDGVVVGRAARPESGQAA